MNDMTDQTGSQEPAIDETITFIGRSMGRMRLMIGRRFIGKLAISRVGASMELSHLDVIAMVRRLGDGQEVTIGAIAEQLRVDPSRSSRIVADLVRQGLLRREVSQEDARRTIVVITPLGQALLEKVDEVKRETIREIVADWPQEDIERFAELYDRFINGFDRRLQQFEAENGDQVAADGMAYGTARAASRE
ncbi:MarR family winged helix-turn-helix transcriptional regulator [Rhizobium sp. S95]|uniref:MarR family winged helix-turn-helix transcriptional regulator n=1 Tax=Ciceribacter sichuanensis TaxID=2949647 RepID=A0AAJ1BSH3_9HYPH|nr:MULTISPECIES: MarR family winged helix-turn-helix transcriptional regulator [unclassified Ciceribacter]MCM2395135.1 MarR family winged helix-turn-helix transcriptional regulator [Ciceribacter sp. S95]MCO5955557.1 MarR family winged helix-turn-helix transcriptional regulator [Ciceribacter sp. S101]